MAAIEYSYITLELEWYFVIMLSKIYVPCVFLCKLPMAQYRILFLIKEENDTCCCFRGHGSLGGSHGNNREDWGVWNDWGSVRSRVTSQHKQKLTYFKFAHVVMTYSLSSDIWYMTTWRHILGSSVKQIVNSPAMSVHCSVFPHGTVLLLDRYSRNIMFGIFTNFVDTFWFWLQLDKKDAVHKDLNTYMWLVFTMETDCLLYEVQHVSKKNWHLKCHAFNETGTGNRVYGSCQKKCMKLDPVRSTKNMKFWHLQDKYKLKSSEKQLTT